MEETMCGVVEQFNASVTFLCTLENSVQAHVNKCCEILRLMVSSHRYEGLFEVLPQLRRLLLSWAGSETLNETIQHLVLVDKCRFLLEVPEVWISLVEQPPVNQGWAVNLLDAMEGYGSPTLIAESVGHRGMHHLLAAAVNAVGVDIKKRVASIAVVMLAAGPHQVFERAIVEKAKGYLVAYMDNHICTVYHFSQTRLVPLQKLQLHGADITYYDFHILVGRVAKCAPYDSCPVDLFGVSCEIAEEMREVADNDLKDQFGVLLGALPRLCPRLSSLEIQSLRRRLQPLPLSAELVDVLGELY